MGLGTSHHQESASILARRWRRLQPAMRDLIVIAGLSLIAWLIIERTETCTRMFRWIADHPEWELDSLLLTFFLAATGLTVFSWRRYREMIRATSLALRDPLTGLANRRALDQALQGIKSDGLAESGVALIYLDLDRFKPVNDLHGHAIGDELLRMVAARLRAHCVGKGTLFRLGGDEFAITVAFEDGDPSWIPEFGRKATQLLAQPFADREHVHWIGASAGIAYYPTDATHPGMLMRRADTALYHSKLSGRGCVHEYRPEMIELHTRILNSARMEQELRAGLARGEIWPCYQPIVDLATGRIVGVEMLARWRRADGEERNPDQFIPVAEAGGMIHEMTLRLLEQACVDAASWNPQLIIGINVSPIQLRDPWFCESLLKTLTGHGIAPGRISIEVTEDAQLLNEAVVLTTIRSFRNLGMRISLDDFGTGYSSLNHLRLLPIDTIKIDRSFVEGVPDNQVGVDLIKAIVGLARTLDKAVVVEGIEDAAAAELIREVGCGFGQGYYFGRSMSADAITIMLEAHFAGDAPARALPVRKGERFGSLPDEGDQPALPYQQLA